MRRTSEPGSCPACCARSYTWRCRCRWRGSGGAWSGAGARHDGAPLGRPTASRLPRPGRAAGIDGGSAAGGGRCGVGAPGCRQHAGAVRGGALGRTLRRVAAADGGRGLWIATHDVEFARACADRVAILADGMVVEAGSATEVLDRPGHPATRALLAEAASP